MCRAIMLIMLFICSGIENKPIVNDHCFEHKWKPVEEFICEWRLLNILQKEDLSNVENIDEINISEYSYLYFAETQFIRGENAVNILQPKYVTDQIYWSNQEGEVPVRAARGTSAFYGYYADRDEINIINIYNRAGKYFGDFEYLPGEDKIVDMNLTNYILVYDRADTNHPIND